jgi:hypothetical protein
VKRFGKIILACTFFTAILAVSLKAQPASASAGSAVVAPASGRAGDFQRPRIAGDQFNDLHVDRRGAYHVIVRVTTWKNIKEIPSGMQNVMEALVEGWEKLIGDILDKRVTRWVFPFATTFFIFIVISNLTDLIPGVGSIGFTTGTNSVSRRSFRPPTTDANLTVAMAGIFLVMSLFGRCATTGFGG